MAVSVVGTVRIGQSEKSEIHLRTGSEGAEGSRGIALLFPLPRR